MSSPAVAVAADVDQGLKNKLLRFVTLSQCRLQCVGVLVSVAADELFAVHILLCDAALALSREGRKAEAIAQVLTDLHRSDCILNDAQAWSSEGAHLACASPCVIACTARLYAQEHCLILSLTNPDPVHA